MPDQAVNVPEPKASPGQRSSKARGNERPKTLSAAEGRHSAKCRICNHPDRAAIEFDFLNWRNPADLAHSYRLRDISTVYRHAHATGLFAKRRLNLRFALERIVERVNEVPVTGSSVIRAARAISRINDAGEWVDPPSHLVIHRADSDMRRSSKPPKAKAEIHPRPSPIFDDALLDEPLPSAAASGEMPRIPAEAGRPAPAEVILEIAPELYEAREKRRKAIEADRQAAAAAKGLKYEPTPNQSMLRPAAPKPSDHRQASGSCSGRSGDARAGTLSVNPDPDDGLIANETHSRGESND